METGEPGNDGIHCTASGLYKRFYSTANKSDSVSFSETSVLGSAVWCCGTGVGGTIGGTSGNGCGGRVIEPDGGRRTVGEGTVKRESFHFTINIPIRQHFECHNK